MTIIQNLIHKNYSSNQNFNNIISQGINMPEVDLYLKILDQKAYLVENGDLSQKDSQKQLALEVQSTHLLNTLRQKLICILNSAYITSDELSRLSHNLITTLSNNIDINAVDKKPGLHKVYLVSKIILDIAHTQCQQQDLTI